MPALRVSGLTKSFVVHAQGDLALPVLRDVALALVNAGETRLEEINRVTFVT